MKPTNEISDPAWKHIYDRDKEITRLEAELLALGDQLTDSDCQLVDALAENGRLTKALEQITRLSPRTMAVSEAQHIAGKALKGRKQ